MNTLFKKWLLQSWLGLSIGLLGLSSAFADTTTFPFEQELTLSDPCAVFNQPTDDPAITRITYGENIDFDLKGTVQAIIEPNGSGGFNLKFMINNHGAGIGQTSGIKYQFISKLLVKANTNGSDPNDPNFVFKGKFKIDARIIGQGNDASQGGIAQGAQDNALLHFYVSIHYANGSIQSSASDFTLECVASPWTNQMTAPEAGTKTPVGRGFGDPWNKYAWSMKDFNGGMVVGTKNAYFDIEQYLNPTNEVQDCINGFQYQVTGIHLPLACMELFSAGDAAQTRYADIWRFDYAKKSWTKVLVGADSGSQGFRVMTTHNGKLYAGSDLGAFITGVSLNSGGPLAWDFPSSQLLVSADGKNFSSVGSCTGNACNPATGVNNPYGITNFAPPGAAVNTSIRALASYNNKLYVGTFNAVGAELWSYDDSTDQWDLVHKFFGKPAIAELREYKGKLYIGIAGPGNDYLWQFDGTNPPVVVANLPVLPGSNVGALKLFVSSKGLLYIGNVDLTLGFYLQSFDGTNFTTITSNGFFNSLNAYAWSMAEINGRLFVGTFNQDFISTLPRGSAELWYSDDSINWQQMAMPLDWGVWNYGIRTMEVGDKGKQLFLGSASNMIAPDLISEPIPLNPGAEVWSIRSTAVAPTGKRK